MRRFQNFELTVRRNETFTNFQELERSLLTARNPAEAARGVRRFSLPAGVNGTITVANGTISIIKNEAHGSTAASVNELSTSAMQEAARILSAWLCIPADSMFFGFTHSWPDRPGVWAVKCVHMPDSAPYDVTIIRSPTPPPQVSHFRYGYICQLPVIGQPVATNPPPKTRF